MFLRRDLHACGLAFSLVEMVMATAIVAFSLLVIAGLMPIGLKNVHDSENEQAFATIATQVRGQLQQINFTNSTGIGALNTLTNSYSAEGLLITSTTSTNITPYYAVTFSLTNAAVADSNFSTNNSSPVATNVVVSVTYPPPTYNQTNTFSVLVTPQSGL